MQQIVANLLGTAMAFDGVAELQEESAPWRDGSLATSLVSRVSALESTLQHPTMLAQGKFCA